MRFLPTLLLALPTLAHAQAPQTLQTQLQTIAAAHHGQVSLYAEDLTTHQTVSLAPDTPVQTASVIKLAILYEALQQIRAGRAHFDDRLTLTPAARVPGSGILRFLDAPLPLTFRDVLTLMIVMSDNAATNLAIDHLGLANINARIASLGLKDTYLYKKVFTPIASGTTLPEDFKQFGLGKTTPREISTLMSRFVRCDLAPTPQPGDQALCAAALDMLHHQFTRTAIPRYLDALPGATETSIANKTGALDAVRNDVAAVATPHGIILISAFTSSNGDRSWGPDHEAELTIAKLARAILASWSPEGLAPWPPPLKPIDKAPAP